MVTAASEMELFLPKSYDIFWSLVILIIVAVFFYKFFLPKFQAVFDERAAKIEEGLGAAEQAKADQAAAALKREEIIREAHAEAHTIRERANDEAKAIVAAARHEATSEANRILEASERQILAEKQAAQISLRSEVGLLASELAEKIIGEHLTDTALTSRVVDRFLDELEADSARVEEKR